ncbi:hypothetical protein BHE74_00022434 [Ensete ventricosum]|nr:hypothetical protein BHE74_00022434 [Ensete ventricosum]
MVSRVGRMSSASSHSEFRSVKILAHKSRVLSCPSGDYMLVAVIPSSSALGNSGTFDALAAMRSFFNVDSTVTTHRLVEVRKNYFIPQEYELHVPLLGERPYDAFSCGFGLSTNALEAGLRFLLFGFFPNRTFCRAKMFNLGKMNSDGGVGNGSTTPSAASAPATRDAGVSAVEKRRSSGLEVGLRKHLQKVAAEQPVDASRSTARTSADKGKGMVELKEVPEQGYTMRELCEVEDRAGADRYFASIMMRLKCIEGEDLLVPRWSIISGFSPFRTKGALSEEYLRGALHPTLAKQVYECSSEELMNRADKSVVLSQHEKILALRAANKELKASIGQELAATTERWVKELEDKIERIRLNLTELKAKGQKAIATYKASRGFESGLEKMGRVSYEFRYRVALERLRGKHPYVMIEVDPFTECS